MSCISLCILVRYLLSSSCAAHFSSSAVFLCELPGQFVLSFYGFYNPLSIYTSNMFPYLCAELCVHFQFNNRSTLGRQPGCSNVDFRALCYSIILGAFLNCSLLCKLLTNYSYCSPKFRRNWHKNNLQCLLFFLTLIFFS